MCALAASIILSSACFVSSSQPQRCLLSFPTRRSSDLLLQRAEQERSGPHGRVAQPEAGDVRGLCGRLAAVHPALGGPGGDRKSTRLNSSHSSISYAVFCLKKKEKRRLRRGEWFRTT